MWGIENKIQCQSEVTAQCTGSRLQQANFIIAFVAKATITHAIAMTLCQRVPDSTFDSDLTHMIFILVRLTCVNNTRVLARLEPVLAFCCDIYKQAPYVGMPTLYRTFHVIEEAALVRCSAKKLCSSIVCVVPIS
jgi:hypothetical protein